MKIKILKDIPGYKAGEEIHVSDIKDATPEKVFNFTKNDGFAYDYCFLIKDGFAEEIKDDIDIEAIRNRFNKDEIFPIHSDEINFFNAYRIVKAVIDQLNEDWKPDEETQTYEIYWYGSKERMNVFPSMNTRSMNPLCKDKETAQRVIELCEPELKVLFGVK